MIRALLNIGYGHLTKRSGRVRGDLHRLIIVYNCADCQYFWYLDPQASRIIYGADFDVEFAAIAAAIDTKLDTGSTTITDLQLTLETDKGTGTISRGSVDHLITRTTGAAVTYTMEADSTANWNAGDRITIACGNSIDVTVDRAGAGVFTLPNGSTATSIQTTTAGKVELINTAGDDNWLLIQQ